MTPANTQADAAIATPEIIKPATREWTMVLVRHGETEWNAAERIQGHHDVPLSETGIAQARRLGARIAAACRETEPRPLQPFFGDRPLRVTALYASDLCRASQTAEIALAEAPALSSLPLVKSPSLRERSFGAWEGLTAPELRAQRVIGFDRPPGGETETQVYERMQEALDTIAAQTERSEPGVIFLFGHGGSLRALICRVLGLPAEAMRHFRLENTSVSVVTIQGAIENGHLQIQMGRIVSLNDATHLLAPVPEKEASVLY